MGILIVDIVYGHTDSWHCLWAYW